MLWVWDYITVKWGGGGRMRRRMWLHLVARAEHAANDRRIEWALTSGCTYVFIMCDVHVRADIYDHLYE